MRKQRFKILRKTLAPIILIVLTTLLLGLMNTVFVKPEDEGSWRYYVGYLFLFIAAVNILVLIIKLRKPS